MVPAAVSVVPPTGFWATLLALSVATSGCASVHAPSATTPVSNTSGATLPLAEDNADAEQADADPDAEEHDHDEEAEEGAYDSAEGAANDEDLSGDIAEDIIEHSLNEDGVAEDGTAPRASVKSPLADISADELKRRVAKDQAALGCLSLGLPNRGRLINGAQLPASTNYTMTSPGYAWGTLETIENLTKAIDLTFKKHPDSKPLIVGHISAKNGGRLRPHKSHQAGRDVDISYFYTTEKNWYAVANERNLDVERTWTFVKALLKETPVEMIFIDSSIQRLLKAHALRIGEDRAWLDQVFQSGGKSTFPIIRHVKGHATHIHIRFWSPIAQASGRIAAPYFPTRKVDDSERVATRGKHGRSKSAANGKTESAYIFHQARSGDTLDSLARRYGVSVQAIQDANNLRSNRIKMKHTYKIPKTKVAQQSAAPARQRTSSAKRKP
jgi:LysM repeat protein